MNIGTSRVAALDQRRQAEYWLTQVERFRQKGWGVKVKLSMEMAFAHIQLAEAYEQWMEIQKKEER